jgi:hypothetical protein
VPTFCPVPDGSAARHQRVSRWSPLPCRSVDRDIESGGVDWPLALGRASLLARLPARTLRSFLGASHRRPGNDVPALPARPRQLGEVAVDELLIAVNALIRRVPTESAMDAMVERAARVGRALGDITPADLYPPVGVPPDVELRRERAYHLKIETATFASRPPLPRAVTDAVPELLDGANRSVTVRLMRHPDPRPWVVVLHGTQQGTDMDLLAMSARHLHAGLGLNVALPVLPFHGARSVRDHDAVGFDPVSNLVLGVQGAADIRATIAWIRSFGDEPLGVYGVSLGGYFAALVAGVETVDLALAGVPVLSIPHLIATHLVRAGGKRGRRLGEHLESDAAVRLDRLVDPLTFAPQAPHDRRFVVGGLGDRVTTSAQALALWEHWDRPTLLWYPGGHVGYFWSSEVRDFTNCALRTLAGLRSASLGV